jgi:hypothetical protein
MRCEGGEFAHAFRGGSHVVRRARGSLLERFEAFVDQREPFRRPSVYASGRPLRRTAGLLRAPILAYVREPSPSHSQQGEEGNTRCSSTGKNNLVKTLKRHLFMTLV